MDISDVYRAFPTKNSCQSYLEKIVWRGAPICPYCKEMKITEASGEGRHHCNICNSAFSITVGTLFHRTHMPLQKWFLAIFLILIAKEKVSVERLCQKLGVNKNTGYRVSSRVREAMFMPEQRRLLCDLTAELNLLFEEH